jgi:DNA-binding response OmpR family regulator
MTFFLQGANILIVEDDFLVALEVETVLQDEGAHVLPICRTVTEALAAARDPAALISVAILDVRLGREMVTPVARELAGKGAPFLFYTGQANTDPIVAEWPGVPVLSKPTSRKVLLAAVAESLQTADRRAGRMRREL